MTVSTTTNKVSYVGNGIATEFAIPFPFLETGHLKVFQLLNDIQTIRTDWTVQGGNLVFTAAPVSDAQIVIMREVPMTQETDFRENEILAAETLERDFDKLTMQVQQLKEKTDRAVTVDVFDDTQAAELLPSIRSAVSMAAGYANTAQGKLTEATQQAVNAAQSAATATAQATLATAKATEATNVLESKADKNTYATKSVRGLALWANNYSSIAENRPACVIANWVNGTSWYRIWSDGWIEQGCCCVGSTAAITWPKSFSNTNYTIVSTPVAYNNYGTQTVSITSKSATAITWAGTNYSSSSWYACGY